jgi:hypothetical protein
MEVGYSVVWHCTFVDFEFGMFCRRPPVAGSTCVVRLFEAPLDADRARGNALEKAINDYGSFGSELGWPIR